MKNLISIIFLIMLTFCTVSAQTIDRQVITTAGNTISNDSHILTFTIGEPIVGKIQNNATIINQGFLAAANSDSTLSVDDQLLDTTIKVYPNPVTENLSIDLKDTGGEAKVTIYTMTGQLVKSKKLKAQNNSLNISQLKNGLYLVNLIFTDHKTIKTFKIIKK